MAVHNGEQEPRGGYTVVHAETTGLRADRHDRVTEIAVVHVDPLGRVTGEWTTLVNPERESGPPDVHGIGAADLRFAPTFAHIAGALRSLLAGRVVVGHDLTFEVAFLGYEFARLGVDIPLMSTDGISTMSWAPRFLPTAPRSLAGCCAAAGIRLDARRDALTDARACAALLRTYLLSAGQLWSGTELMDRAAQRRWPMVPDYKVEFLPRNVAAQRDRHFLGGLVDRLPRIREPATAEPYLALLDRALLDHHISADEADALAERAADLGLNHEARQALHREYLDALALTAWEDGVVDGEERDELRLVARLLGLDAEDADRAVDRAGEPKREIPKTKPLRRVFGLDRGDTVVFTGQTVDDRVLWEDRARTAGLLTSRRVTEDVRMLVAADPDSASVKAVQARELGVPIVSPDAFDSLLADL